MEGEGVGIIEDLCTINISLLFTQSASHVEADVVALIAILWDSSNIFLEGILGGG